MIETNISKSDIEKLTNKELKNKIKEINNDQLSKIGNMAFYYFINTSGELLQKIHEDNIEEKLKESKEKEKLLKAFRRTINSFENLQKKMSAEESDAGIMELLRIREEVHSMFQTLKAYEIELAYTKELLDHHMVRTVGKGEYKNIPLNKEAISLLIRKLDRSLSSNIVDNNKFINIVSNMLSIMPFRMTKSKFFNILKMNLTNKFHKYPKALVEHKIEEYKMEFDSSLMGDYGIIFGNYFGQVQNFKNKNIKELPLSELEIMGQGIVKLMNEMKDLNFIVKDIGVLINRLIVLILTRDKSNFNEEFKDIYLNWETLKFKGNKKLLDDILISSNKRLDNIEKELLENVDYFQNINNEGINRRDLFDKELDKEVLFAKEVLTYYNDIKFLDHDILFLDVEEIVSKEYLSQLIDSLIQYINRSTDGMKNIERKMRMRRLLAILELPFRNMEEFISYIEYSLDERVASKEEILFTIDTANYWLDEFNKKNKNAQSNE